MKNKKTIYLKYTAVFLVINILCFAVILFTVSMIIDSYIADDKTDTLASCAEAVGEYIDESFAGYMDDIDDNIRDGIAISSDELLTGYLKEDSAGGISLETLSDTVARTDNNLFIFLTAIFPDGSEKVIFCNDINDICDSVISGDINKQKIPEKRTEVLSRNSSISGDDDMNGFFKKDCIYYAYSLKYSGERADDPVYYGSVFCAVSSENNGASLLIMKIIRNVLITGMWVMLASLILIYAVTERMLSPIRAMHKAARAFANGQFDARIKVSGNDEIAELSTAFNNMAQSLQELDDMRRSFLANISHDLRTPMTTITGLIDGILDGAIPPEKQDYYLNIIASETRRLSRLVSQLLDISRLEAGEKKFDPEPFDICEMGREIVIGNIQRLEEKKLDVRFECEKDNMYVMADKDAIHQVFYNICDNAIKFAREGGVYKIDIFEKNSLINVSVYDEGESIPEEDLAHVFDRFYKSDKSRGMDKSGVGLGMFIARAVIEAHGQKIFAESDTGWTRFTFTLPKAPRRDKEKKKNERNGNTK